MFPDTTIQASILMYWDVPMRDGKPEQNIPDDIPIFWVNII